MAQESPATIVEQDAGGPLDQPEDGKNSLLSKVKEKAKGTVQKLTSKVKRGSDGSTEEVPSSKGGKESTIDDLDESSASEAQSESKEGAQTAAIDGVREDHNDSEQFGTKPEDDKLRPFARSEVEKGLTAAPLIATPTCYGEPHTTFDDVMPPTIIEPTSVSELGEESSASLGYIPEARDDEEKAAAKEVATGGPDADINEGFKEIFRQKDLQAIDGLPKPRGFDVGNEDRVHSGDLAFQRNQAFADQTKSREAEGVSKGGDRDFPVNGAAHSQVIEQDKEKPHSPGSVAEFKDSMFTSNELHDLKPNEPNAAEAKHAGEIGTFSRDFDPVAEKSSGTEGDQQHPPGSTAEFKDSMFSSGATHDLKPDEPKAAEAKHAGEIGTFSRDFDPVAEKSSGTEGDQQHPPGSTAEFKDSMFSSGATHDLKPDEPKAAEAKHAGEIGTFSRGFDPEAENSSGTEGDQQHPPGSTAEFKDSMFSSGATHDLNPNEPNAAEAKHAGEIGTFSRGAASESETDQPILASKHSDGDIHLSRESKSEINENFQDSPKALPPPALASDVKDSRQIDGSSAGKSASFSQGNRMTEEEEAENYFDVVSDYEALDSDISTDFNPEATDEYIKQRNYLADSADARVRAAMNDEIEASETHSASKPSESMSTLLVSTLKSVVDTVGSKAGLVRAPPQSSSS